MELVQEERVNTKLKGVGGDSLALIYCHWYSVKIFCFWTKCRVDLEMRGRRRGKEVGEKGQ